MTLSKKWSVRWVLILAISLGIPTFQANRAEAGVGALTWNVPLMVSGLAWIGLSATNIQRDQEPTPLRLVGVTAVALVGCLLLDTENGPTLEFVKLSDRQARSLGISEYELSAYNDSVDEVNAIAEEVLVELSKNPQPTPALSVQAWRTLGADLDPAVLRVAAKISVHSIAARLFARAL